MSGSKRAPGRRVRLLLALCAAAVLAAAPAGTAQGLTKVKFSYFPAFHTMVVMVASGLDLFRQEGLDVEMIQTSSGALQPIQLITGEVDFTTVGLENVVALRREGKLTLHVYLLVKRMSQDFVVRNDALRQRNVGPGDPIDRKLAALRGLRIGYTLPNAPTDRYARHYVKKANLTVGRDVELLQVGGPPVLVGAIRQGRIDAFMLTPPTPQQVELDGVGQVFIKGTLGEVKDLDNYPYTGISVRANWARQNRDGISKFVRALANARRLIAADKERSLGALRKFFPTMDDRTLRAGYDAMLPALSDDGTMREEMVKSFLDLGFEIGILSGARPSSQEGVLWTNEFIPAAARRR